LIEAIAKAEKIAATEGDVEAEIAQLSRQYRQPREAIFEMLRPNLGSLIDGIVRTKTVEFLLDHAKVTETRARRPERRSDGFPVPGPNARSGRLGV
jgi:trigger factor